jgi:predicted RNA binding protein YcfA (HicA-like mRNA interferase family)
MKRKDLEKFLKGQGWIFEREGGNHAIWSKSGVSLPMPRHKEIKENTAKSIMKQARSVK